MAKTANRSKTRSHGRATASAGRNKTTAARASTRRDWSTAEDKALKTFIKENTPTRVIGLKLKRSEAAVRQHVSRLGLSLRPANRSPYG